MNNKKTWLPTSVDKIKNSFKFECSDVLKKNLAYNIQYLQFLLKNIEEEETTSVLYRMRYKTFVVISMSVIEAIFIALLDERNLIPTTGWKDEEHVHKKIDDNTIEVSFKRKKVQLYKKNVSFEAAINLIEKHDVLGINDVTFPIIRKLQKLRNHLHLDKAQDASSSDYNNFTAAQYEVAKLVFYYVMRCDVISLDIKYLDFVKI